MNIDNILPKIDAEIDRLQQARALLLGTDNDGHRRTSKSTNNTAARTRRILSPAARKRIADAQKKRWAEARKNK